ncbi:OB-fold-containig protein [Sediminitomix flava]|uniref:Uncharacterized protein DUF1449 n=1 Tax=Sediminitomix flava TaxID=379075 RepID=A0A316A4B5_SEDFL|nr:OB-fold-containig protein [Sediminitomix flava]PWJ44577.1 uncharacterized protein DUF1449 [Sediminitomix flava]
MEFLIEALQPINLPYTILVAFSLLYWMLTFLGIFDIDAFDVDMDADVEADVDMEGGVSGVEIEAEAELEVEVKAEAQTTASAPSAFVQILQFFHIGQVPLMAILTFLFAFMWVGSVLGNHYLENTSWTVAALLFVPVFLIGLTFTKIIVFPLSKFFNQLKMEEDTNVIGNKCTVILEVRGDKKGQVEVQTGSYHQKIYAVTGEGKTLKKGSDALVIDYDENKKAFIVEPY